MANPNLLDATSMYAKLVTGHAGGTVLTCPADKLIKIVRITLNNNTGSGITNPEIHIDDESIWSISNIADDHSANADNDSVVGNLNSRMPIYLQETKTLKFINTGAAEWTVSYEEYDDAVPPATS